MITRPVSNEAYELLHRGSLALARVEANGIHVDTKYLHSTIENIAGEIEGLEKTLEQDKIYTLWQRRFGRKMSYEAPQQLAQIVFGEMGHKNPLPETATKKLAASQAAFVDVDEPFIKNYFQMRKLLKAKATLIGINREVCNDFIHPFFDLHTARTFRSSSHMINFQNLQMRNASIAKLVRTAFTPRGKGYLICEKDFKGIEVAVAACYNKDKNLIKYVSDPKSDMHGDMAMQIFILKKFQVDKKGPRDASKNKFVFPEFYGSFYKKCAPQIWMDMIRREFKVLGSDGTPTDLTVKRHLKRNGIKSLGLCDFDKEPVEGTFEHHLMGIERDFWDKRFPEYKQWKRDWYAEYLENGYFQMKTGFVIHGYYKRNDVTNYPIQGSAFHLLLMTLILLDEWLIKKGFKTRIIGQIHDSLIMDIWKPELERVLAKIDHIVTVELPRIWDWIIVPLQTETEVSETNWYEKRAI